MRDKSAVNSHIQARTCTCMYTQVGALRARLSEAEEMRDKAENQLKEEERNTKELVARADIRCVHVYVHVHVNVHVNVYVLSECVRLKTESA
jgi:hypothetical protein